MSVTAPTSQSPIDWLNALAPLNISAISCAFPTSHAEMSVLKDPIFLNKWLILVIAETSHVLIVGVHTPTGDASMQLARSRSSAALVVYTGRGDGDGGGNGGGDGCVHAIGHA